MYALYMPILLVDVSLLCTCLVYDHMYMTICLLCGPMFCIPCILIVNASYFLHVYAYDSCLITLVDKLMLCVPFICLEIFLWSYGYVSMHMTYALYPLYMTLSIVSHVYDPVPYVLCVWPLWASYILPSMYMHMTLLPISLLYALYIPLFLWLCVYTYGLCLVSLYVTLCLISLMYAPYVPLNTFPYVYIYIRHIECIQGPVFICIRPYRLYALYMSLCFVYGLYILLIYGCVFMHMAMPCILSMWPYALYPLRMSCMCLWYSVLCVYA